MREIFQNRYQKINIILYSGDRQYTLTGSEKIIFGLKKDLSQRDSYIISKVLTSTDLGEDGYELILTTADTDITPGYYYYDIALRRSTGELEPLAKCEECYIAESSVRGGNWT